MINDQYAFIKYLLVFKLIIKDVKLFLSYCQLVG